VPTPSVVPVRSGRSRGARRLTLALLGAAAVLSGQNSPPPPATNNFPRPGTSAGNGGTPTAGQNGGATPAPGSIVPGAPVGGSAAQSAPAGAPPPPGLNNVPGQGRFVGPGGMPPGVAAPPGGAVFNPAPAGFSGGGGGGGGASGGLIGGPRPSESVVLPGTGPAGASPSTFSLVTPGCDTFVSKGEIDVAADGEPFEVTAQVAPANCHPRIELTETWIASSGERSPGIFAFSAQPNLSRNPREAVVVVGAQKVLIRQAGKPGPQFAVAPSSLSLRTDGEHAPHTRTFSVFSSDNHLTYTVASAEPWLKVVPAHGRSAIRRYEIKVDPELLPADRSEAVILVNAAGSADAPIPVRVTVEIPRPR